MRAIAAAFILISCSTAHGTIEADRDQPMDIQPIDRIINDPAGSDGTIVQIEIFPFDNGFTESYRFCLEVCLPRSIELGSFIIYTSPRRFAGADGTEGVSVRMRFDGRCFTGEDICPDSLFARFFEIE